MEREEPPDSGFRSKNTRAVRRPVMFPFINFRPFEMMLVVLLTLFASPPISLLFSYSNPALSLS